MKLFVANTSQQKHDFIYRVPERTQTSAPITINPGSQVQIIDATPEIVDMIVEHHRIFGMKHYKEVDTKSFNGLLYSFDAPVPMESFFLAEESNDEVLTKRGEEIRQVQAAATSNAVEQQVQSEVALQVQVIEENRPGVDAKLNETIKVEKKGKR